MKKILTCMVVIMTAIITVGCTGENSSTVEAPTTTITTTSSTSTNTEESTTSFTTTTTNKVTSGTTTTTTIAVTETSVVELVEKPRKDKIFNKPIIAEAATVKNTTNETTAKTKEDTTVCFSSNTSITNSTTANVKETTTEAKETTTVVNLKSLDEIANEVLAGRWGNGDERKQKLIAAGYDYDEVCNKVQELKNTIAAIDNSTDNLTYVKSFSRGTYYCYGVSKRGGSGRSLIPCNTTDEIKGSIASSYLYKNYGYNYNGERTKVYLEISSYPEMNGYYYLDDSDAGNSNVIDFYYIYSTDCPFRQQGVVSVECWIAG